MDCERAQDSLSDHVEGNLPQDVREAVERHLAGCAACRDAREGLVRLLGELASLPRLAAPPELLEGVMGRIASAPLPATGKRSPWRFPLQAAATLLLVALGYGIGTELFRGGTPSAPPAPAVVASLPAPQEGRRPAGGAAAEGGRRGAPAAAAKDDGGAASAPPGRPTAVPRRLPQEIPAVASVSTGGREPSLPLPAAVAVVPPGTLLHGASSREVILFVPAAARREAAERVAQAARRCGALPPGHPPVAPFTAAEGAETVRVVLPRPEAARFVSELRSIGSVATAFAVPPQATEEGEEVPFTVRLVAR